MSISLGQKTSEWFITDHINVCTRLEYLYTRLLCCRCVSVTMQFFGLKHSFFRKFLVFIVKSQCVTVSGLFLQYRTMYVWIRQPRYIKRLAPNCIHLLYWPLTITFLEHHIECQIYRVSVVSVTIDNGNKKILGFLTCLCHVNYTISCLCQYPKLDKSLSVLSVLYNVFYDD